MLATPARSKMCCGSVDDLSAFRTQIWPNLCFRLGWFDWTLLTRLVLMLVNISSLTTLSVLHNFWLGAHRFIPCLTPPSIHDHFSLTISLSTPCTCGLEYSCIQWSRAVFRAKGPSVKVRWNKWRDKVGATAWGSRYIVLISAVTMTILNRPK